MKKGYISLKPLIDWRRIPRPVEGKEIFNNDNPLIVEIGCGNGEYIAEQAKKREDFNFIGIDKEWQSVWRALREVNKKALKNVKILKADARWVFDRLFKGEVLEEVYCLFPCPWPKSKHEHHRLFSRSFFLSLNRCLKSGKILQIITDDEAYMRWVLEQSVETGFEGTVEEVPPGFSTKYERKWVYSGKKFFYKLTFEKISKIDGLDYKEPQLVIHKIKFFDPNKPFFKPIRGDIVVEYKDFLYDPFQQRALVRAFVLEDNFVQDFWIEIVKRDESWLIRPAQGCGWIPTVGVQRALDGIYKSFSEADKSG